jgi:hypothetical protein
MTLAITTIDRAALPTELLSLAKQQMRVDTTDNDAFIESVIARAIAKFEQINDVTVNPSIFTWQPASTEFAVNGASAAMIPVRPVSAFVVTVAPDDVTADYALALKWDSPHGVPIQQLAGSHAAGMSVALTAGYADLTALPPAVLDVVLRTAAHLYEHREILIPDQDFVSPDLQTDATWWMPRV